jgi:hypothetical protein
MSKIFGDNDLSTNLLGLPIWGGKDSLFKEKRDKKQETNKYQLSNRKLNLKG